MALTNEDQIDIALSGIIGSTLSLFGSLMVVLLYLLLPSLRTFKGRLLVYLSIADIVWTAAILTGLSSFHSNATNGDEFVISDGLCQVSGFLLQWFIVSEDFWIATIAIYLFFIIVKRKDLKKKEWIFHVINWGVPFLVAILPFLGVGIGYGIAGTWCWVIDPVARLVFSYFFVWTAFVIIIVCYGWIVYHIRDVRMTTMEMRDEKSSATIAKQDKKLFKKLAAYPIIFLIQWIPATINRVQNAAAPTNPIAILFIIHVGLVTSSGLLNFITYGSFNKKAISAFKVRVGYLKGRSTENESFRD